MDLTIEQGCPSCGASIVLFEDDRLIRCTYCDVNNYRLENGAARYLLPCKYPDHIAPAELFFVPYLRFKGTVFYVADGEVGHKIVDSTRLGIDEESLPLSLGLRPQAMKLVPVVATIAGMFVKQTIPIKTAFAQAVTATELFSKNIEKDIYHRAFIGETLSCIYQPCYLQEGIVYDAVTRKALSSGQWLDSHSHNLSFSKTSWEPQFISTICPECSGLLDGERDGLVLHCRNCASLWQEVDKKFQPLDWQVVNSLDGSAQYLPFWKITFSMSGWAINSFGDYLRFTHQPLVVNKRFDTMPLVFWIPAFKLNPKSFLQLAGQMTISQWRFPEGEKQRLFNDYPVNLSQKEAIQAIKSVLAVTTLNKDKKLPLLPQMTVFEPRCLLTYLPFIRHPHDVVQVHTSAALPIAALRVGRKL